MFHYCAQVNVNVTLREEIILKWYDGKKILKIFRAVIMFDNFDKERKIHSGAKLWEGVCFCLPSL